MTLDLIANNHNMLIVESESGLTLSELFDQLHGFVESHGPIEGAAIMRAGRGTYEKIREQIWSQTHLQGPPMGATNYIRIHSPFGQVILQPEERRPA